MQEETQSKVRGPDKDRQIESTTIYSSIRSSTLSQIKNIDVDGSFGTKIDTLARHLFWIRENDPGAKSVVFSQFRDFLDILAKAFAQFKIGFTTIDKRYGTQKFKHDPSVCVHHIWFDDVRITDEAAGRVLLPSRQSTIIRIEPRECNARFLMRTSD